MRNLTLVVCSVLFVGLGCAQQSPVADKKPATPEALKVAIGAPVPAKKLETFDALKAEIEALRDAKIAWRKVEWRTCLLGALNEAAREKKPLFLWVLGGAPADGRC
jgi:hypothetical protein